MNGLVAIGSHCLALTFAAPATHAPPIEHRSLSRRLRVSPSSSAPHRRRAAIARILRVDCSHAIPATRSKSDEQKTMRDDVHRAPTAGGLRILLAHAIDPKAPRAFGAIRGECIDAITHTIQSPGCVIASGIDPRENPIMSLRLGPHPVVRAHVPSHARRQDPCHISMRPSPRIHHEANRSVFHCDLVGRRAALSGTALGADDRDERRRRACEFRSVSSVTRLRRASSRPLPHRPPPSEIAARSDRQSYRLTAKTAFVDASPVSTSHLDAASRRVRQKRKVSRARTTFFHSASQAISSNSISPFIHRSPFR